MTLINFYKINRNLVFIAFFGAFNLFGVSTTRAQDIEAQIRIVSVKPSESRARVTGRILNPKSELASKNLSFLRSYADADDLGSRIENLNLFDENGGRLEVKKLADGEYLSNQAALSFEYDVKTDQPKRLTSAAHVSWLDDERGMLMLADLMPQWNSARPISARILLKIPSGWKISTSETADGENSFVVPSIEKAIFLTGKNWREEKIKVDKTDLNLAIAGVWQFSDDEAAQMASSILEVYRKIFGDVPRPKIQILLLPFPGNASETERWRAETRGATVTILSGALPFKSQAVQRLHEQLRHEIFHLWLPNAVVLTGNYDWFYEGFTVYQALRTGVSMNQIRFEDYLDTLARASDMSRSQTASLVEMSSRRWTGAGNNSVYAKGMITAFLCDAALLRQSKGKRSLADVSRQIYQKHRAPNAAQNGNTAVLAILNDYPELRPFVRDYIEGAAKFNWANELKAFGIEATTENGGATRLKVTAKPDRRQKDLLDELGYNQWRKLLRTTK